jgi:hypothetical protein
MVKRITVAVLAFICTFLFAYWLTVPRFTVDQLESAVDIEAPVGSNTATVQSFLERNGIDHSEITNEVNHFSVLRADEFTEIRPFVNSYIGAIIHDTEPAVFGRWVSSLHFSLTVTAS